MLWWSSLVMNNNSKCPTLDDITSYRISMIDYDEDTEPFMSTDGGNDAGRNDLDA